MVSGEGEEMNGKSGSSNHGCYFYFRKLSKEGKIRVVGNFMVKQELGKFIHPLTHSFIV